MERFLDMALCDQSMNVIFAVGSGGHQPAIAADQVARPTGPTAQVVVPAAPYCKHKRQHQPAASVTVLATAQASAVENQLKIWENH